jgi:hypothetical protein
MKVYVVIHNFVSHDMFVPQWAKEGNPVVFGVFSTKAKAQKHIRPTADDYIQVLTLDAKTGLTS